MLIMKRLMVLIDGCCHDNVQMIVSLADDDELESVSHDLYIMVTLLT